LVSLGSSGPAGGLPAALVFSADLLSTPELFTALELTKGLFDFPSPDFSDILSSSPDLRNPRTSFCPLVSLFKLSLLSSCAPSAAAS